MPKDTNKRTARQKDADELHMTSNLAAPSINLLTLIEGNTASIDTTLDISLSAFRDAILGAGTKDFSTIQTVLDSIKDTDGIKKITDAVTVIQPNPALLTGTVTQLAKDRTITGNVGVLDSLDARINPAKEDGNLSSIKTNTDNLNITTSAFRDAILGAGTKDFSTIQTVLDSIKDTDGIKKITDNVTVVQDAKDRTISNTVDVDGSGVTQPVSGTVTAKRGHMDYTTLWNGAEIVGDDSNVPVWIPDTDKKIVLTDIIVSANGTGKVIITCADGELFILYLTANIPVPIHLESHYTFTNADDSLLVSGELANEEWIAVSVYGYEVD